MKTTLGILYYWLVASIGIVVALYSNFFILFFFILIGSMGAHDFDKKYPHQYNINIFPIHNILIPHLKKIPFLFTFSLTLFIAGTISLTILESNKGLPFLRLWPYQMTLLTFILGWESYRMYKTKYPTPTNYQIDRFLEENQKTEVK